MQILFAKSIFVKKERRLKILTGNKTVNMQNFPNNMKYFCLHFKRQIFQKTLNFKDLNSIENSNGCVTATNPNDLIDLECFVHRFLN